MKMWALCATSLVALSQLPGCFFVEDDDRRVPSPVGTLTVQWSIDGTQNPLDCADLDVDRLELSIYSADGRLVEEVEPFCESFTVSVDLLDGLYTADVTLVDSFDNAATFTETLEDIDIIAGTDLAIDVDFPIDSFL
ncbi:MAG TPA: hypothetical protein VJU61_17015 [Polyangiaceae bacterium]|nr:hypothetical protein [Polyangiaceae bacterium]